MAGSPLRGQSPIGTIISEQSRTAFSVQGAGARATGLGGAFIAVADDATAVSFNPAGLAQLLKPEVSFVGRGLKRDIAYTDVATIAGTRTQLASDSLISTTRFDPLLVSGTVPLRLNGRTLALQLSAQRFLPLGESDDRDLVETPASGGSSSELEQSIHQRGQIDLYSFAIAYEASERILLGLSANAWRGAWDLDSHSSKTTGGSTSFVDFRQSNRLDGMNYNLGLIWRWPTWSLGLVRRTGFHGDYTFGTDTLISKGGAPVSRNAPDITVGLHWPATTGIGFAYRPAERWLVTADLTHTTWSDARYMTTQRNLNGLNFFDLDKGTRTPNATDFHLGTEHLFVTRGGKVVSLRGGVSREPQPVVDAVTSEQRVIYSASLGAGIKFGRYSFDAAYRYGWSKRSASQFLDVDQILSRIPPTSLGTERVREQRLVFDCIIQFDREPVQKLLHHLFVGD
ncbi:MAG TPA: outer membrane protein transport protein [Holophagaceae bacterium]|jgi:long-chain fatty acid transport protein|nr:outer membrane protein transport protein [Holophagaceae bacterium]